MIEKTSSPALLEGTIVPLLQELIRNRCVNDGTAESGGEIRSARTLQKFFSSYGIESEILESAPGRASIIARLPGGEPGQPSLGYLNHLDVVPANDEDWTANPYGGEVRGGYVWGRGALDMLSTTATQAVAFAELARSKARLPGDLVFVAAADEEASGRLGARWLVENHWDKVKSDYIVTELGGFFSTGGEGGTGIAVTVGEKGIAWTKLKARGVAGHGSLPWHSENAAATIGRAVARLSDYAPRLVFSREYEAMVAGSFLPRGLKAALLSSSRCDRALEKLRRSDEGAAKFFHAASRLTVSPNVVAVGSKINIVPDRGTAELDIRILPGQTVEYVISEIKRTLGDLGRDIQIEIIEYFPSASSPVDTPLYEATSEIVGAVHPLARPVPFFIGGVTDGRFFRKMGTVVYGFMLANDDLTLTEYASLVHGKDERVSVKTIELSYHYFSRLPEIFFDKVRLEQ
ncbi:MAG: M20/M25/M40 family metallo-hydrolase [Spirochaetales bacterium]|nr:M20/M25/M40 family metallo-hydrolase [Spirochaetales bacterium]